MEKNRTWDWNANANAAANFQILPLAKVNWASTEAHLPVPFTGPNLLFLAVQPNMRMLWRRKSYFLLRDENM